MKKISMLFCTALFSCSTALLFAGNKCEVILPGDHSPKSFKMSPNVKEGDYLPNTIIFKVKQQYRQNCKVNSVDNLLPLQDFLQNIGAQNLAKIYPTHRAPEQERNALGQKLVDLSLMYSFKYTGNFNLEKTINQMLSLGYFEYVEPWYVPTIHLFTPNDLNWSANQYHLKGNVTGSINTQTAWMTQTGNASIILGNVDTGTEPTHPDLAPNMVPGYDVAMNDNDPTWQGSNHGCATSGDACAATNNSIGVASPGFNCKFMPVKIADATGALVAAYQGITYAADHGCQIISNSWGGAGGGQSGQDVINYAAINKNCLVIASAGNAGGTPQQEDLTYPACYNNVYRVAASTSTDAMAGFSSFGYDVAYTAPGNAIYSTINGTGYGSMSGTSMACPVSAGAAGLIQSPFYYTNAFQIGERLKQTCDPMPSAPNYTAGKLGKGRIDVGTAVSAVATKSLTMNPVTITDGNDNVFLPSEVLTIHGVFINYLDPSSASAAATLSVVSGPCTITNGSFTIGALATLAIDSNTTTPFTATINAS